MGKRWQSLNIKELAMDIISIGIIDDKTFNVFIIVDNCVFVDQCYNDDRVQRFQFADIQKLLIEQPDLLDKPLPEIESELLKETNV